MKKLILSLFVLGIIFWSCKKSSDGAVLNLSAQWQLDFNGNLIKGVSDPNDKQWQNQSLSTSEMGLFESLDTADLAGTSKPSSVSSSTFYPNPFTTQALLYIRFNNGYNGQVKFKYVVVDKSMHPVQKGTALLSINQAFFHLFPDFPSGYYRIYFTLSSQGDGNFYTSWGNIQQT